MLIFALIQQKIVGKFICSYQQKEESFIVAFLFFLLSIFVHLPFNYFSLQEKTELVNWKQYKKYNDRLNPYWARNPKPRPADIIS